MRPLVPCHWFRDEWTQSRRKELETRSGTLFTACITSCLAAHCGGWNVLPNCKRHLSKQKVYCGLAARAVAVGNLWDSHVAAFTHVFPTHVSQKGVAVDDRLRHTLGERRCPSNVDAVSRIQSHWMISHSFVPMETYRHALQKGMWTTEPTFFWLKYKYTERVFTFLLTDTDILNYQCYNPRCEVWDTEIQYFCHP